MHRKQAEEDEAAEALARGRSNISWVSAKLMEGRGTGNLYDNYGEMLYAEGLEAGMIKEKKVRAGCGPGGGGRCARVRVRACGG